MPIKAYFKGKGLTVMRNMLQQYGVKKGKNIFYATANSKPGMKPKGDK